MSKFDKLRTIHIKNVPKNQEFENQLIQVSSQQGNLKIIVQHPLFNEREISPHFNLITIQKCGGSFSFHQNISTQELSKIATLSLPQGNSLLVDNIFYKYSVDPFSIHPANLEKIDVSSTNSLKENQFEAAILDFFS